ncbi:MAG: PAS domain-containing protein [Rhodospirillales bacterium]|jgi:PAS domain S-box-containing protein|nr:PAS domain-containing protein [Rhodospirillales bacterium]
MINLRHMNVLLVEDNPGDARLVQMALGAETLVEFDIVHVDSLSRAKEQLQAGPVDAILLDLSLPDSFGMNTVRSVMEAAPMVPIVVLTGLDDAEVGYKAVKEGAQDYLVKGHTDGDQLRRAILYAEYRKSSQLTIERLNQRLDHILNALGEGVVGLDMNGATVFLNPEILRMTGTEAGELMGRLPHDALREVDMQGVRQVFEGSPIALTLRDGEVRHVSDVFLTKTGGEKIPVEYIVTPMQDGGRIEGAVVAYHDVSDRQHAFDVLQRQLGFHQQMIDALPLPIFYLDAECVVLGCNLAFERRMGKSAFAFLGQDALKALPEPIAKMLERWLDRLEEGESCSEKIVLADPVTLTVSPIVDPAGELLGFAGTLSRI